MEESNAGRARRLLSQVSVLLNEASTLIEPSQSAIRTTTQITGNQRSFSSLTVTTPSSTVDTSSARSSILTNTQTVPLNENRQNFEERSSVLAELRRQFQPHERRRSAPAGRSALQDQEWSHRFSCLDSPACATTPLRRDTNLLAANGLGLKMVVASKSVNDYHNA